MATTIGSSDLTTRISESITLNGTNFSTSTEFAVTGITQYVNNVFNVDTGNQTIIVFSQGATPPRNGEYDINDVSYLRVTNADDTTSIIVVVSYVTTPPAAIPVAPGGSFVLSEFSISTSSDSVTRIDISTAANVDVPYVIGLKK